jgi:acyl-CoA synthetase (AMP-forming)/AMP-acid ligase II
VALARDGLLELLREKGVRASPWTEDLARQRRRSSVRAAETSERVSHRRTDEERKKTFTTNKSTSEAPEEEEVRFGAARGSAGGGGGQAAVVLAFPPGLDFLVAFLACQACSVVAVPYRAPDPTAAGPRFAEERAALFDVAAACGARVALTSESYAAAFTLASVKLACSLDSVGRAFRAFRAFRFVTIKHVLQHRSWTRARHGHAFDRPRPEKTFRSRSRRWNASRRAARAGDAKRRETRKKK